MRRREFITLLGGAATWPLSARAQQRPAIEIGYLYSGTAGASNVVAFSKGLSEAGFVEGRDVIFETRWGDNQIDRLPALVADLVRRQVALIVANPLSAALAAKAATTTIPILFQTGSDPVKAGLVSSFNRPGGNLTGVGQLSKALAAKRLELLHEIVPKASVIGVLADRLGANNEEQVADLRQAALALGPRTVILDGRDLDSAFASVAPQQIGALFVGASAYFYNISDQITLLAAQHRVPAIYESREFPEVGGLISYGVDFSDVYRQLGLYAGRILEGEKPADLPVVQPSKFELVIDLKTAKALGLTIPPGMLAIADEVIE